MMQGFFLKEAVRSFRHHRGLATTAIISLTSALVLSGMFLLVAHNAGLALHTVGDRREMVVYLNDSVSPDQVEALSRQFESSYGIVSYVSKDQAWTEFSEEIEDPALLEAVEGNPLPASLRIKLKPELLTATAMEEAAKHIAEIPEVEDVVYGGEWVRRLDELTRNLQWAAIVAGVLIGLAVVFMMYNTIRLSVLARRLQVEIMSRLGATDGFIVTPFVFEAIFEAGVAAIAALALVFGIQQGISAQVVPVAFLPWTWALGFLAANLMLAWLAASLALNRVLRAIGA
jgi:cell division transport system permease protein